MAERGPSARFGLDHTARGPQARSSPWTARRRAVHPVATAGSDGGVSRQLRSASGQSRPRVARVHRSSRRGSTDPGWRDQDGYVDQDLRQQPGNQEASDAELNGVPAGADATGDLPGGLGGIRADEVEVAGAREDQTRIGARDRSREKEEAAIGDAPIPHRAVRRARGEQAPIGRKRHGHDRALVTVQRPQRGPVPHAPQPHRPIRGARDEQAPVWREPHRPDPALMALELPRASLVLHLHDKRRVGAGAHGEGAAIGRASKVGRRSDRPASPPSPHPAPAAGQLPPSPKRRRTYVHRERTLRTRPPPALGHTPRDSRASFGAKEKRTATAPNSSGRCGRAKGASGRWQASSGGG